jgi:hypothetical protein
MMRTEPAVITVGPRPPALDGPGGEPEHAASKIEGQVLRHDIEPEGLAKLVDDARPLLS